MCGRFYLDTYPQSVVEALIDAEMEFTPKKQIYPTNEVAVAIKRNHVTDISLTMNL